MTDTTFDIFSDDNRNLLEGLHKWKSEAHHYRKLHQAINTRAECYRQEQLELQRRFAESRGWRVSDTAFSLRQLKTGSHARLKDSDWGDIPHGGCFDHCEFYRDTTRPYRPAAIITHPYARPGEIVADAASKGLYCEFLPWSWYYPGSTTAAVLTPALRELKQ